VTSDNFQTDLERIIRARDLSAPRGRLEDLSPADFAGLLVRLGTEGQVIVFRVPPREIAAFVLRGTQL
jgi:hypothetical protein